jgi:tRNA nucleotidyltransferase (CCA-adding enzyme)
MTSLPPELLRILSETPELAQSYLVGGSVRDWLLGIDVKDYDIEVFGLGYEQLVSVLSRCGKPDLVGRSFGVIKLRVSAEHTFDFSIPRRDSKIGIGHKGFAIEFDPSLTPKEASARRDFTINSLMYDPRRKAMLDFFGGESDLRNGILRHTSAAFPEDPLRVLRGMQFAARFKLTPAAETVALCRSIKHTHAELASERIREEWFKWAEKSVLPSLGLRFLVETEWIEHYPEINRLRGTPQDPEWHPEGDVFVHTGYCCDAMAALPAWQTADAQSKIVYMLSILAHDFAKPQTTERAIRDGRERIISPGHEEQGGPLAEQFLDRINAPTEVRQRVVPLVTNHLAHMQADTDRAVRRLSKRLEPETIDGLILVMSADSMGRPPHPPVVPASIQDLAHRAADLSVDKSPPKPILQGRHLIALGMTPGPGFGPILNAAYDAQLAGEFFDLDQAHRWLTVQTELGLPEIARAKLLQKGGSQS